MELYYKAAIYFSAHSVPLSSILFHGTRVSKGSKWSKTLAFPSYNYKAETEWIKSTPKLSTYILKKVLPSGNTLQEFLTKFLFKCHYATFFSYYTKKEMHSSLHSFFIYHFYSCFNSSASRLNSSTNVLTLYTAF